MTDTDIMTALLGMVLGFIIGWMFCELRFKKTDNSLSDNYFQRKVADQIEEKYAEKQNRVKERRKK